MHIIKINIKKLIIYSHYFTSIFFNLIFFSFIYIQNINILRRFIDINSFCMKFSSGNKLANKNKNLLHFFQIFALI